MSVERRRSRVVELGTAPIAEATVVLVMLTVEPIEDRGTDEGVGIDVGVAELAPARPGSGLDAGADPSTGTPLAAVELMIVE